MIKFLKKFFGYTTLIAYYLLPLEVYFLWSAQSNESLNITNIWDFIKWLHPDGSGLIGLWFAYIFLGIILSCIPAYIHFFVSFIIVKKSFKDSVATPFGTPWEDD